VGGKATTRYLGSNYQDALNRLRSLKAQDIPISSITVAEASAKWLKTYVRAQRKERDWKLADQRVRDYLDKQLGAVLLHRLTREHLQDYKAALLKGHLAAQ